MTGGAMVGPMGSRFSDNLLGDRHGILFLSRRFWQSQVSGRSCSECFEHSRLRTSTKAVRARFQKQKAAPESGWRPGHRYRRPHRTHRGRRLTHRQTGGVDRRDYQCAERCLSTRCCPRCRVVRRDTGDFRRSRDRDTRADRLLLRATSPQSGHYRGGQRVSKHNHRAPPKH
jgi:hypothetical protein